MPEITVSGVNPIAYPTIATWHWHVALYLFVGGLVAGMMIFSSWFRLVNVKGFERAILISDLLSLPLIGIGMFFLWIDLARRWNAWRFYATFEVTSPMSWGSWILLFTMILLFLRMLTHVPSPAATTVKNPFMRFARWVWRLVAKIGSVIANWNRVWDVLALLLGAALGLYTGVLLNTIPARPLWNSSILPLLFLASGLASGCAFLCLFIPGKLIHKLAPAALAIAAIELVLLLSYILTLTTGTEAMQRSSELLLNGSYALVFWVLVVGIGVLAPALIESAETMRQRVPLLVTRLAPILTLVGGAALRFVIVYAGLESFI